MFRLSNRGWHKSNKASIFNELTWVSIIRSEEGETITEDNLKRAAVVGIGNVLLGDEGVGVHVARAFGEVAQADNADIDVIDGGTSPDVFLLLDRVRKLILIDAVNGGGSPGSIYRFHPDDIVTEGKYTVSAHQIDLWDGLRMMELSGCKPDEVVIIGVEPKEISWGTELSPELRDKIPQIVKVVMSEIYS